MDYGIRNFELQLLSWGLLLCRFSDAGNPAAPSPRHPGVREPAHDLTLWLGRPLSSFVEMGDDVVGHDAGLGCRRVVDWGDDLDQAVLHGDLDAEAAEFAPGLHLHVGNTCGACHLDRRQAPAGTTGNAPGRLLARQNV